MNQNTAGAVLLLILGASAISTGNIAAVFLVAATAALAFIASEFEVLQMSAARMGMALASWVTTAAAFGFLFL